MAKLVYVLCMFTSLACAWILLRAYCRSRTSLLLWGSLCFVGLVINNLLLVVDLILVPNIDFSLWRTGSMLLSVVLLLFGFIWDGPRLRAGPRSHGE